jgi:hypothetical protein
MAQRTAPPPHRHTVILAVATIAAMIGCIRQGFGANYYQQR